MNADRRHTLANLAGIGTAYLGVKYFTKPVRDETAFKPIDTPSGFHRLNIDEGSSGSNPFFRLDGPGADRHAPVDAEIETRAEFCRAFYGVLAFPTQTVPASSSSDDDQCHYCRIQTRKLVEFHMRLISFVFQATPAYLKALAENIILGYQRLIADVQNGSVAQEPATGAALRRTFAFVGTPVIVIGRTVTQGQVSDATLLRVATLEIEGRSSSRCAAF